MTQNTCLVAFASNHGQTNRIATRIAERLRDDDTTVTIADVATSPPPVADGYDLVVVGGSIRAGRHQRSLVTWLRKNAAPLNRCRCAVFSVSLSAGDPGPDGQATARKYLD